jgi:phage gpG-like protein
MKSLYDHIGAIAVQSIKSRIRRNQIKPKTDKTNKKGQKGTTLIESARLLNSISYKIVSDTIVVGTNLAYARIHHEGGNIKQTITDKMKKYFWAKFYETKIEKWKFMALSKQGMLNIHIPARPYLFLDDDDEKSITKVALTYMEKYFLRNIKGLK